jgi:signal peptidase I
MAASPDTTARRHAPPRARRGRTVPRRALTALWALWLLAAVAALVLLRPGSHLGVVSYVVVTGHSMEPTLHTGDAVVVLRASTYRRGDVVAYRIPAGGAGAGVLVIHRIVGGDPRHGFVLRGDNKTSNDPWRPRPHDVAGRLVVAVPKLGYVPAFVRSAGGLALVAGLITVAVALGGGGPRRRGDAGA